MNRRLVMRLLCAAWVFLGIVCWASLGRADEEVRTWTDKTGKHKVEASFKELVDGKLTLIRKGGKEMEIELSKLSADDQAYVAKVLKDAEDDPFKVKSDGDSSEDEANEDEGDSDKSSEKQGKSSQKNGQEKSSGNSVKVVKPNWSEAENIPHAKSSNVWKLTPSVAEGPKLKARTISTPGHLDGENDGETVLSSSNAFVISGSIVKGRGGGNRMVTRHEFQSQSSSKGSVSRARMRASHAERHGNGGAEEDTSTKLTLCDFAEGKVVGTGTMPGKYIPVALDDKGTRALMREEVFGFDAKALELWDLTSSEPNAVLRWYPAIMDGKGHELGWGAFLPDDRLVTLDKGGELVVWNAKTAQPIAYLKIGGECTPAISPDGKCLVYGAERTIGVLDLKSLEVIAETHSDMLHDASFAFSPDGKHLACVSGDRVTILNFADGTQEQQIPLAGLGVGRGEILWPHEKYLLLGKSHLFDIENQVVVWHYNGARHAWMAGGLVLFGVPTFFKDGGALILASVPPPNLDGVLAKAMEAPDFFVLAPGTTVKLNVDQLPQPDERDKVRAALTEKLTANGCKIGPEGSIELVATVESKPIEQTYRKFGLVPETEARVQKYTVQEFTSRLAFIYQGKPAWQSQAVSTPHLLRAKPGQTIEAALHETEKPNYEFMTRVSLPKKLMKPMPEGALGSTRVSREGLQ